MKKAILTMMIGLGLLSAQAGLASQLTLRSFDNALVTVELNNRLFTQPSQVATLNGVRPGNHWITVMKHLPDPYTCGGTVAHIAYEGYINIPARSRVVARLNPRNNIVIRRVIPVGGHVAPACAPNRPNRPIRPGRTGYGRGVRPAGNGQYGFATTHQTGYAAGNGFAAHNTVGMHPRDFQNLKHSVNNANFDNARLLIAKQGINGNFISSRQVLQLMNMMNFERNRLELAKFAYASVADPENFHLVNNAFSFSSSVRELDRFLHG